jgi:dienelactone hydrolase
VEHDLSDLHAAVEYLQTHLACRGRRVGSVGYGAGGGLSALLASSEPDLAAAVNYCGISPPPDRIGRIRCPILGF